MTAPRCSALGNLSPVWVRLDVDLHHETVSLCCARALCADPLVLPIDLTS